MLLKSTTPDCIFWDWLRPTWDDSFRFCCQLNSGSHLALLWRCSSETFCERRRWHLQTQPRQSGLRRASRANVIKHFFLRHRHVGHIRWKVCPLRDILAEYDIFDAYPSGAAFSCRYRQYFWRKLTTLSENFSVLHYTRLRRLAGDKHSSLLDPFVSYEENEVLWIWPQSIEIF